MKRSAQYGLLSVIFGFVSIVFAFIATHADSVYYIGDGWFVIDWFDKFGLINNTPSTPTLSQASILTISERNVIFWSYTISILFALYSIISVFIAELKREHTLLFSVGYVLASSALVVINLRLGLISIFVGFVVIMVIRNKHKPTLTHHSSGTPNGAP